MGVTTIYFGEQNYVTTPLDCTLGWARKRRLAASFEKTLSPTVTGA